MDTSLFELISKEQIFFFPFFGSISVKLFYGVYNYFRFFISGSW